VVVRIDRGSRVYEAGVRQGDIILQVNQKDVTTLEEYRKAAAKVKTNDRALMLIRRKGEDLFVTIKPK
jgi:serine protease Do